MKDVTSMDPDTGLVGGPLRDACVHFIPPVFDSCQGQWTRGLFSDPQFICWTVPSPAFFEGISVVYFVYSWGIMAPVFYSHKLILLRACLLLLSYLNRAPLRSLCFGQETENRTPKHKKINARTEMVWTCNTKVRAK